MTKQPESRYAQRALAPLPLPAAVAATAAIAAGARVSGYGHRWSSCGSAPIEHDVILRHVPDSLAKLLSSAGWRKQTLEDETYWSFSVENRSDAPCRCFDPATPKG